MLAGRLDEAQQRLDEGMALLQQMGEHIYLPDLLLIQARRLELHALLARYGSSAASKQDLSALAALLDLLPEERESAPAHRARKLWAMVPNVQNSG